MAGLFSRLSKRRETTVVMKEAGNLDSYEYQEFDQVVLKKGYKAYRDLRYDDQVKFCLMVKKLLILSAGWEVVPAEGGEEQAEFITSAFEAMVRPFDEILMEFLSAFDYGFCLGEKIWARGPVNGRTAVYLANIKMKLPWDVSFAYDAFGNISEVKVKDVVIPPDKYVLYSYMSEFGNAAGESDLKAAYNPVWLKSNVWKFQARHLERFGSPIVKGHAPVEATTQETDKFFGIINRLHSIVAVLLPRTERGDEFDFELLESKREGAGQFNSTIEMCDGRTARSLLIPSLFGATKSQYGSYALGVEQFRVVYKFLAFIGRLFAEGVVDRQIIRPIVDLNFGEPRYPKFRFKPIDFEIMEAGIRDALYPSRSRKPKPMDEQEPEPQQQDGEEPEKQSMPRKVVQAHRLRKCPECGARIQDDGRQEFLVCKNGHPWHRIKK